MSLSKGTARRPRLPVGDAGRGGARAWRNESERPGEAGRLEGGRWWPASPSLQARAGRCRGGAGGAGHAVNARPSEESTAWRGHGRSPRVFRQTPGRGPSRGAQPPSSHSAHGRIEAVARHLTSRVQTPPGAGDIGDVTVARIQWAAFGENEPIGTDPHSGQTLKLSAKELKMVMNTFKEKMEGKKRKLDHLIRNLKSAKSNRLEKLGTEKCSIPKVGLTVNDTQQKGGFASQEPGRQKRPH